MSEYDMQIISGRQCWHGSTYIASPERMSEYVQTSGGRVMPGYEKGLKAAIDSHLPDNEHLWTFGHYLWSAEVEANHVMLNVYRAKLFCKLHMELETVAKPDKWKEKTARIITHALEEARYLKPADMSASRKDLYTSEKKERLTGVGVGHFVRDAKQHWDWVGGIVDEWERLALVPVCEWMNNLKDRVA
jgi:hypothetical protein